MVLSLLPTAVFAADDEANGSSENVVKEGYVPSGVKKNDDGSYQPIDSTIQYKITEEADGSHTLTFWSDSGNVAFPTFNTEQQVLASDGTVGNRASYKTDDTTYPGGYVEDSPTCRREQMIQTSSARRLRRPGTSSQTHRRSL